jgi:hypothetical protein
MQVSGRMGRARVLSIRIVNDEDDPKKRVCGSCGEVWTDEPPRPKEYDLFAVEVQGA